MLKGFITTEGVISVIVLAVLVFLALFVMPRVMRKLTGILSKEELAAIKQQDALVLDVRTRDEFFFGKVEGSMNIPWDEIPQRIHELDPSRPILLCCASGFRSAKAIEILKNAGFTQVYNAGAWMNAR